MSGNEEEKDARNAIPLDLARNQIAAVRTAESKPPLVISQALRSVRVLAQGVSCSTTSSSVGQTIITNIMPQAVIKQDGRAQIASIISSQAQAQISSSLAIQRPAQITLTSPIVTQNTSGTTYHVPRGPAVVANLAAPRSNITAVRSPMVVSAQSSQSGQSHPFVKPPSPAQGTAWLTTNSPGGAQVKGAPTVLSSPVRGATVTGKLQVTGRPSQSQTISTIKSGTILQSGITIGQTSQVQTYKPISANIQSSGSNMTLAQIMPTRTQAVIYGTNSSTQFTPTPRAIVTSSLQNPTRSLQTKPTGQISSPRLPVPVTQIQSHTRLVTSVQSTPVMSNTRISALPSSTHHSLLGSAGRIIPPTQPTSSRMSGLPTLGTTTVTAVAATVTNSTLLSSQPRTLNIQSLVAVANGGHSKIPGPQATKIIPQPAQATIHLTSIQPAQITTKANTVITTGARTINVPATIVTQQRSSVVDHPEGMSIGKVFSTSESPGGIGSTNVFIHGPIQTQRQSLSGAGPASISVSSQQILPPSTVTLTGNTSYFYESANAAAAYSRPIGQQPTAFAAIPQGAAVQQARSINNINSQQTHGIVSSQNSRFSSVVMVEQNRIQQSSQFQSASNQSTLESQGFSDIPQQTPQQHHQQSQIKVTSSPRPSILRKRDHEGSPLKAAKNLTPVLQTFGQQSSIQGPLSPQPPRPDSRDNGHSSGGSTTISATSSPGLAEVNEDSNPPILINMKDEEVKAPLEMSPRKKPRKQQLTGNEIDGNIDDMQFISENGSVKKENYDSDDHHSDGEPKDGAPEAVQVSTMRKPASASLLNGYRQTWKATHNHYQRYSDVKPKDERRPTIMDLANQNRVVDKVNGWKIHHLSTQMENLADEEQSVYNRLTELLKFAEAEEGNKQFDKELNRINELIKGNLQRIKIINDGMLEAKSHIMKICDHQRHVMELINRCASKRNFKKREKS
ncbi:histone deacetylase complex subunit SAP130 isoform X2 [Cylas formicarius]|uniref:histone deacetylase complex subunit SAP130 isoform X2 n=1 Tax=Cylas formicarius TaxID=197179 RepID=UPI0029589A5D|nr:histone deacetylase complex subunit SAP130 isoform X2 [Cylas formicarius]